MTCIGGHIHDAHVFEIMELAMHFWQRETFLISLIVLILWATLRQLAHAPPPPPTLSHTYTPRVSAADIGCMIGLANATSQLMVYGPKPVIVGF